jgi:hypothetical protein
MITIKQRFTSATLLMLYTLIVSGALQVHAQESSLIRISDEDKSAIVESVLQQELKAQSAEFTNIINVSSENIAFIEPSKISKLGFTLISPAYIRERKKTDIVEYVTFKRIEARGEKVIVTVSWVVEGRPCFGPAFSREQNFIYEYHMEPGSWTGELIRKTLPFSFDKNLNAKH